MRALRVWWIPQISMKSFYVPVSSLQEARLILDILAMYDIFQFENKVKPDYSNTGGLQYFDENEKDWLDWYNEETSEDFEEYSQRTGLDYIAKIKEVTTE